MLANKKRNLDFTSKPSTTSYYGIGKTYIHSNTNFTMK